MKLTAMLTHSIEVDLLQEPYSSFAADEVDSAANKIFSSQIVAMDDYRITQELLPAPQLHKTKFRATLSDFNIAVEWPKLPLPPRILDSF